MTVGIFGLSTHKVCHRAASLRPVVSSCLALAPLPEVAFRRFSFCGTCCPQGACLPASFPLGSMVARVARTFLPRAPEGAPAIGSVAVLYDVNVLVSYIFLKRAEKENIVHPSKKYINGRKNRSPHSRCDDNLTNTACAVMTFPLSSSWPSRPPALLSLKYV